MAAIIKTNLKIIKVGKTKAELQQTGEALTEEQLRVAKTKASETAATQAKAYRE